MLTVRLESTIDNSDKLLYNKLFTFDSISSTLNTYISEPFELNKGFEKKQIEEKFAVDLGDNYKLIINEKVKDSYSFPFKLFVDITDKCQLNCKHCLNNELNLNNELEYEKIKDIIDECDRHGLFFVKLGGGEPLLHPNIFEIIRDFSSKNIKVSLSTNAYLVDEAVASIFKKYNVKVSISLEGPKQINDLIRENGHYAVALNALKILKKHDCDVILRITLTRFMLNENYINEMISLAKENNVKLKISYCRPAGNAIGNELLIKYEDKDKYYKIIKLINDEQYKDLIIMDEGMQIKQDPNLKKLLYNGRICGAANRSFHINSSSQISPCVFLGSNYLEIDSNYEKGDIINYWSEKKGTKIRNVRDITIPKECESCDRLCKFECSATKLYFNDTFSKNDPNCLRGIQKCLKLR